MVSVKLTVRNQRKMRLDGIFLAAPPYSDTAKDRSLLAEGVIRRVGKLRSVFHRCNGCHDTDTCKSEHVQPSSGRFTAGSALEVNKKSA